MACSFDVAVELDGGGRGEEGLLQAVGLELVVEEGPDVAAVHVAQDRLVVVLFLDGLDGLVLDGLCLVRLRVVKGLDQGAEGSASATWLGAIMSFASDLAAVAATMASTMVTSVAMLMLSTLPTACASSPW